MPQYKKVFDVGTYAGVSGYTRVGIPTLRTPGAGGKQVAKSLRFRSANTAYLNRTFGTAGDRQKLTFSFWIKVGAIQDQHIFASGPDGNNRDILEFVVDASNNGELHSQSISGGSSVFNLSTTRRFTDVSRWYHIVVAVDTTNATSTERVIIYVDGIRVAAFKSSTYPSLSTNLQTNSASIHTIGRRNYTGSSYLDGYLSEFYIIDGQQLTASSFGEYNSDNIWVPKAYSGSFAGTNSFYLDFSDVGTTTAGGANTGYGKDLSGKGTPNNWTTNNFGTTSTATTYDSMYDSPTDYDNSVYGAGNYCVLNPLNSNATTLNNANLSFIGDTGSTYAKGCYGTMGVSSGKWYFESTITTVGSSFVGVAPFGSSGVGNLDIEAVLNAYSYFSSNGNKYIGTGSGVTSSAYGYSFTTNDVIGVALDLDNGAVYFGKQTGGTGSMVWQNSGDPTSGASKTGAAFTGITGSYTPAPCGYSNSAQSLNFGQRPFSATPPTGFKALNTKNITRPTDANMWFYGDTPDLMWIKNRTASSTDHSLTDTVRGVGLGLSSSSTAAEQGAQDVAEMNKFGMTLIGASSRTTAASNSFVYWAWKGGSSQSSIAVNAYGSTPSIASIVSANVAAGFSVVTYTGTGANATVGHGLGVAPSMVLIKDRDSSSNGGAVYHTSIGATKYLKLYQTTTGSDAEATDNTVWNGGSPTFSSSVFSIGTNARTNSTDKYVAYCFAPVAGYSSAFSYTGNGATGTAGSADGPFVYLNFRPRFIILKRTDTTGDWVMIDTSRDTYNVANNGLLANTSGTESTGWYLDVLSNGFKIRTLGTASHMNASGGTYVGFAWAENPFRTARAR